MRLAWLAASVLVSAALSGCWHNCGEINGSRADWREPQPSFEALWTAEGVERFPHAAGFQWLDPSLDALAPSRYAMTSLQRSVGEHQVRVSGAGSLWVYGPRPADAADLASGLFSTVQLVAPNATLAMVREAVDALVRHFQEHADENAYGSERSGTAQLPGPFLASELAKGTSDFRFGRNDLASGWQAEIGLDRVKLEQGPRLHFYLWIQGDGSVQATDNEHNQTVLLAEAQDLLERHGVTPTFDGVEARDRHRLCEM